MSGSLDILYIRGAGAGWAPIDELARLAARLMEGRLLVLDDRGDVSFLRKAAAFLPPRRRRGKNLVVLAAAPGLLAYTARLSQWRPGYETITAWVIDSFWTDRIPQLAKRRGHFDQFFITDKDLTDEWTQKTGTPTGWLPWGTDCLAIGTLRSSRPVDLLRLGRQPEAWDDDEATIREGRALGLAVSGRPPMGVSATENQKIVRGALTSAKFVLAFHNLASPAAYTHPTRSYITGRWTDALAAGATVVGVAPWNSTDLLWPGAVVEISSTDRRDGLIAVAELARNWTPEAASAQQLKARQQLDWRYRIRDLVTSVGAPQSAALSQELTELAANGRAS